MSSSKDGTMARYAPGGSRSAHRLETLGFNPIDTLVHTYRRIEDEIDRQEKIRSGAIVELTNAGKPRAYRAEVHHNLFDKLTTISEKLLRYRYGRVPELDDGAKQKAAGSLVIQLTKRGDVHVLNGDDMPDMPQADIGRPTLRVLEGEAEFDD